MTEAWQSYIAREINRARLPTLKIAADCVVESIGKDLVAAERRIAALEAKVRELRDRETARRLRAVPSTPGAMIA